MKAFKRMFVANFKEYIRDGGTIFLSLIFPILLAFIFGIVFNNNSKETPASGYHLGIINGDGEIYYNITEAFKDYNIYTGSEEEELEALEKGKRDVVLKLPVVGYDEVDSYNIDIIYNNSKSDIDEELMTGFQKSFIEIEDAILGNDRKINIIYKGTEDGKKINTFTYIFPGILALTIMQLGLYGALDYTKLREKKIMRSLSITPISRKTLLGSELFLRVIIGFFQAFILTLIGYMVFDLKIEGSVIGLFLTVLLGCLTFSSVGYMLVNIVRSSLSANVLVQIITMLMIFMSGIFFRIDTMPGYLKPIMKILPLTYLGDIFRQVMLGVPGEYSIVQNVLVLLGTLLISSLLTIKLWKWE